MGLWGVNRRRQGWNIRQNRQLKELCSLDIPLDMGFCHLVRNNKLLSVARAFLDHIAQFFTAKVCFLPGLVYITL